ncbi:unnamed protein product [Rhizoctonia solani]|uniref:Uncharacterized protein n=1 Tax=Rhizoctonia solani TaxID=456999 RepID=A0A8H3AXH6_9AGAM|nr:unnamed protein product [Rhizoctonia solani]CAE6458294.1 unnamed protein product [Rhizoctonia solani]
MAIHHLRSAVAYSRYSQGMPLVPRKSLPPPRDSHNRGLEPHPGSLTTEWLRTNHGGSSASLPALLHDYWARSHGFNCK